MIYIITAVNNRRNSTERFINCLNRQNNRNWHLVITDDGSTDRTEDFINETVSLDKLSLIKGDGSLWWTGGIQKSREFLIENISPMSSDIVLIANNDVEFDSDTFDRVENLVMKYQNSMVLGTQFDRETRKALDNKFRIDWVRRKSFAQKNNSEISALTTRFLFMDFATFVKAGDFAWKLLPQYHSDLHWTIRAKKRGINLVLTDEVKFYLDQETSGVSISDVGSVKDVFANFFSKRNRVNPVYLSIFELLSAPWGLKLYNFFSTWIFSLFKLGKVLVRKI